MTTGLTLGFGLRTAARYGIGNQSVPTATPTAISCFSQGTDPYGILNTLTGVLTFPIGNPSIWRLYCRIAYSAGGIGGGGADNGVGLRQVGFRIISGGDWAGENVPYMSSVPASAADLTFVENYYCGKIETGSAVQKLTLTANQTGGVNRTIQAANSQLGTPQGYCALVIENLGPAA